MNFGNLSSYLWLAAGLLFSVGCVSAYFLLSFLWRLPERMPKMRGSLTLKPGAYDALLNPPPKKLTAKQLAEMMLLIGALLLAYDVGTKANRSQEHAAGKGRNQQWERLYGNQLKTENK